MIHVAITLTEYRKAESVFQAAANEGFRCMAAPGNEAELAAFVRDHIVKHVIVGTEVYTGALYEALPRGGVVARFGVGHERIDKIRATQAGLLCTNTPGVLDDSVAEHTVGLIVAAARHIPRLVVEMRAGSWTPEVGRELRGKTLVVVGCGPIGCRVAQIASFGFQMQVIGVEIRRVDQEAMKREFGFSRVQEGFAEAVREADFVSLHIPSEAATRHFINRSRLEQIAPAAWLINTARGAVIDEVALYEVLAAGRLAGAALDVCELEPYVPAQADKDLRKLPNVILTPHVGSSTREACNRMAERALENIRLAESGAYDRMNLLNPEVLKTSGTA